MLCQRAVELALGLTASTGDVTGDGTRGAKDGGPSALFGQQCGAALDVCTERWRAWAGGPFAACSFFL
eukprot:6833800-Prymnesium_polylepis.2